MNWRRHQEWLKFLKLINVQTPQEKRLEQFWKERLNAQAARNDCLNLAA